MNPDEFPLIDAIDHEILMHRDAHFGGLFSIMLDYYRTGGKGIQPEFDLSRIEQLAGLEQQLSENLAAIFLTGSEATKVAEAREAYKRLRAIYEIKQPKTLYPQLIADLILSEEENPQSEIEAIVAQKAAIVPFLIDLLKSEIFTDPLFPGYGQAPLLAAQCLAEIGDKRALFSLFEALGQGDFFADEQIIRALKAIGEPAREFLLRIINSHTITIDHEKAAMALVSFKDNAEVAEQCFSLLKRVDILADPCLPTYLALISAGLQDRTKREEFIQMANQSDLPKALREDMKAVVHEWQTNSN
jgi:HEAT repeat protein